MAWCPVPLLWSAPRMITAQEPAASYVRQLLELDEAAGILSASVGVGYQWQDSPVVGASAVVIADGSVSKVCVDVTVILTSPCIFFFTGNH
jgi:microcystin degradation protein MlrC